MRQIRAHTTAALVVASGVNFPDALSANYLARGLATGILATDPNVLPASTRQAILTHHVQEVYVVGGTTAVSDAVVRQIEELHVGGVVTAATVRVARIGGSNRYATNQLVDTYAHAKSLTAIIATGEQFADALSVGPAVYVSGYPLVLTSGATVAPSAAATLGALGVKSVIILGGTSAVSATVESQLKAQGIAVIERLAGADRTQTAGLIATWEEWGVEARPPYSGVEHVWAGIGSTVDIVRGDSFADALVAGPVAGHSKSAILMTTDPSNVGAGIPAFLGGGGQVLFVRTVQAVGGTTAVTDATLAAAAQSIN